MVKEKKGFHQAEYESIAATEHNARLTYRSDIDGLRALAILPVICFHAFPSIMPGGFVGVDIFFVISGFLISTIIFRSLHRNDFSFIEFYVHRTKRIFPALITVLIATFSFGWFTLLSDEFMQLGKHIVASTGFVQNVVLWKEAGYFDTASELKPLMHLWSLAIEEQFYIIFPLLVWGIWRMQLNIFTIILLLFTTSFLLNVNGISKDAAMVFFLPQTRFWEILAGSILAHISLNFHGNIFYKFTKLIFDNGLLTAYQSLNDLKDMLKNIISIFGFGLIFIAIFGFSEKSNFPGWLAMLPVAGAFLLILAGPNAWVNRKLLASRPMVLIGAISYPLYLWHWPLLSFGVIVAGKTPTVEIRVAITLIGFFLAWLTFTFIEKPIRFSQSNRKGVPAFTLVIIMGFCCLAGYLSSSSYLEKFRDARLLSNSANFTWGGRFENNFCREQYPEFNGKFCNLQRIGKPTVMLLGDSHGMSMYYGLSKYISNEKNNVLNLGDYSCLAFVDSDLYSSGVLLPPPFNCRGQMNYALTKAINEPTVHTAILASRGIAPGITEQNKASYEKSMRITLSSLVAAGKRVIFVLDIPEIDLNPRTCFRPTGLYFLESNQCNYSREVYDRQSRDYKKIVLPVLSEFPMVEVFDASASLCESHFCKITQSGNALYLDRDHLSWDGSLVVGEPLARLVTSHSAKQK